MEKTFRLQLHNTNFKEEVLINQKDYPDLEIGDVIEIFSPDVKFSHLLLSISCFMDLKETKAKDKPSISIEQSIASSFHLRNCAFNDVIVRKVNQSDVVLDSVELVFKDQYLARSDMWRIKNKMMKTCVYLNKTIAFNGQRAQVFEMWSQGERVACGYVGEETKVVWRSASSMVYLFIQMSSEMWDYDINGDLYFEKAINGLLYDLFAKWKRFNCTHDVTIVLFSRTFYKAKSTDEFPAEMRSCLQQDHKGRFFEDFYRVAIQNDRIDDWEPVLVLLKKLFNQYEKEVLRYQERLGASIPKAYNSTSSQGNFLEVLNMSLNVFERHYLDRSFDRTGQLSVVISPGVGVFEVDFELSNITKQRIIDNGIGSDLVCLGEQPLHAVPLFKFNRDQRNKNRSPYPLTAADLYNMPHWINLSFYSSSNSHFCSSYVPRIKMPNILPKNEKSSWQIGTRSGLYRSPSRDLNGTENSSSINIMSALDYDEYDDNIFKASSNNFAANYTCQPSTRRKSTMSSHFHMPDLLDVDRGNHRRASDALAFPLDLNDSNTIAENNFNHKKSSALSIPVNNSYSCSSHSNLSTSVEMKGSKTLRLKLESKDDLTLHGYNSYSLPHRGRNPSTRPKALINPFDPSHVSIKLTSNRRRWTHVFPLGPTGIFMQQHHYQAVPQNTACTLLPLSACSRKSRNSNSENTDPNDRSKPAKPAKQARFDSHSSVNNPSRNLSPDGYGTPSGEYHSYEYNRSKRVGSRTASIISADPHTDKSLTWAWGATGEQEWTPAITTGVDWKSLVIPACLPLTTDFIPDNRSLDNDYVESEYSLLPEVQSTDLQKACDNDPDNPRNRLPLTTIQVFHELICQRLQQGFQTIIYSKDSMPHSTILNPNCDPTDQTLSIGRIFHRLKLVNSSVNVKIYRPRHPYPVKKIHYGYRFRAPDNEAYGVSWADFASEKLEAYTWNYLDNYICARGDSEFELREELKFLRIRLLILPKREPITRKVIEALCEAETTDPTCELYPDWSLEERLSLQEGFLKFVEVINSLRRNQPSRKAISDTQKNTTTKRSSHISLKSILTYRGESGWFSKDKTVSNNVQNMKAREKVVMKSSEKSKDEIDGNSHSAIITSDSSDTSSTTYQEDGIEPKKLNLNMSHKLLLDNLRASVNFFGSEVELPNNTFISAEAVSWAIESIEGVFCEEHACDLFQDFINQRLICHAAGDRKTPFEFGFCFYFIVDSSNDFHINDYTSSESFKRNFFEVKLFPTRVSSPNEWKKPPEQILKLRESLDKFKSATIDIDANGKNGRVEWVHARYQSAYHPDYSFSMELQWMVCTSSQLIELVTGWSRKFASTGFHFVPIPNDPFALPFSSKSDPLRGPIFIQLNLEQLPPDARDYLQDDNLVNFRKAILKRFGFLVFNQAGRESRQQFVHVTGSIFVLLPDTSTSESKFQKGPAKHEDICSPHEEYITRHFSGVRQTDRNGLEDIRNGFLWAWNYMITKRWKTPITGDETYMRRFMKNFRRFCENVEDRLLAFWNEYREKEKIESSTSQISNNSNHLNHSNHDQLSQ
ncbi:GATOR complex protein Iml1 isoform X2 [Brevipalpus obovatus]|uniref:GATOR complex protein Iml1 isoform X2 n=1 Tax=Brevipalpus obovatus TaxID=246614 RepID=UPI003D9DB4DE